MGCRVSNVKTQRVYFPDPGLRQILDAETYDIARIEDEIRKFVVDINGPFKANCQATIDNCILIDPSDKSIVVSLPKINSDTFGRIVVVKNYSSSNNDIIIKPAKATETINGQTSNTISLEYGSRILLCISRNEWITAGTKASLQKSGSGGDDDDKGGDDM